MAGAASRNAATVLQVLLADCEVKGVGVQARKGEADDKRDENDGGGGHYLQAKVQASGICGGMNALQIFVAAA